MSINLFTALFLISFSTISCQQPIEIQITKLEQEVKAKEQNTEQVTKLLPYLSHEPKHRSTGPRLSAIHTRW
jgi:hypothetical protein